jgi:hypothetical protein
VTVGRIEVLGGGSSCLLALAVDEEEEVDDIEDDAVIRWLLKVGKTVSPYITSNTSGICCIRKGFNLYFCHKKKQSCQFITSFLGCASGMTVYETANR